MTKQIVLLDALTSTSKELTQTVKGAEGAKFRQQPAPGHWSMADVLSHLTDVEQRYLLRLKQVVEEDNPALPYIHPDEAAHNSQAGPDELLAQFQTARAATLTYLKSLSLADWQRSAIHPTRGQTQFQMLVQFLVDHDREHLHQLAEISAQLKLRNA